MAAAFAALVTMVSEFVFVTARIDCPGPERLQDLADSTVFAAFAAACCALTVGADADAAAQLAPAIRWSTWNGDESATPPGDWQLQNPARDAAPNLKPLTIPYPPETYLASELAAELGDES